MTENHADAVAAAVEAMEAAYHAATAAKTPEEASRLTAEWEEARAAWLALTRRYSARHSGMSSGGWDVFDGRRRIALADDQEAAERIVAALNAYEGE